MYQYPLIKQDCHEKNQLFSSYLVCARKDCDLQWLCLLRERNLKDGLMAVPTCWFIWNLYQTTSLAFVSFILSLRYIYTHSKLEVTSEKMMLGTLLSFFGKFPRTMLNFQGV